MPTPVGVIVDAAQTVSDAYIATGAFYDMLSLFVALAIGLGLVTWLWKRARSTVRR